MKLITTVLFFISLTSSLITAEPISDINVDNSANKNNRILFHEDFENGWRKWAIPSLDTYFLSLETNADLANTGHGFLRSSVTKNNLQIIPHISSKTRHILKQPADEIYWRFYTRFNSASPTPHHWVKIAATDGHFDVRGKAGVKPDGDEAIWFNLDINTDDLFSFYVYWHEMRSGQCNNGTTVKGCEGDQGSTYYYGNKFEPANQTSMPRDEWFCIEVHAKLNDVGKNNGELSMWINDKIIGKYKEGTPTGTWLRGQFHSDGCDFNACTKSNPFTGFNFRTSEKVKFREFHMDAYYQLSTFNQKSSRLQKSGKTVIETQIIDYDDIVVATSRIGCMSPDEVQATSKR